MSAIQAVTHPVGILCVLLTIQQQQSAEQEMEDEAANAPTDLAPEAPCCATHKHSVSY